MNIWHTVKEKKGVWIQDVKRDDSKDNNNKIENGRTGTISFTNIKT